MGKGKKIRNYLLLPSLSLCPFGCSRRASLRGAIPSDRLRKRSAISFCARVNGGKGSCARGRVRLSGTIDLPGRLSPVPQTGGILRMVHSWWTLGALNAPTIVFRPGVSLATGHRRRPNLPLQSALRAALMTARSPLLQRATLEEGEKT